MNENHIGILHPGQMGISVAASAQKGGRGVFWASEARSPQTRQRAERFGLQEVSSLAELCQKCGVLISVCPPHAAEDVADQVLAQSFTGLYVDANAISPQRVERIAAAMGTAGVDFVDGGIIGGPAWQPGTTHLYLSGPQAERVAACFSAGPLGVQVIGDEIGRASALKMCYAAYTKGSTALLCTILAAAEALQVRQELENEWLDFGPDFTEQTHNRARRVTAKAWRFAGEMEEIAATFQSVGLPGGFHLAAADIYNRLAGFKGAETPELEEVLASLLGNHRG